MKEVCPHDVFRIPLRIAGLKCPIVLPWNESFKFPELEALELFHWTMDGHSQDISLWLLTHAYGLRTLTLAFSPPRQEDNENLLCRPGDLQVVQQHVSGTHLTLFLLGRISSPVHSGTTW